jgi:phage terminase large subunit-like protein
VNLVAQPRAPRPETYDSILDAVGLAPSRQLQLHRQGKPGFSDPGIRSDGPWVAAFMEKTCLLTKPPKAGEPFVPEPPQREFLDEALSFDDNGLWVYRTAVKLVPRKNGKSTECAGLSLAYGSSAAGEARPDIPLAAGSKEQAKELFDHARAFIDNSTILQTEYLAYGSYLANKVNGGRIWRVSADGKLQHSLNPFIVIADELHAWVTPKQEELWAALKTAFGARENYLFLAITTAGWDMDTILGAIYKQAIESSELERREDMGPGGFILRDREAKVLVYNYGIGDKAGIEDLDAFAVANPSSWRTKERIADDLADWTLDDSAKLRLYGNKWTSAKNQWIKTEDWDKLKAEGASPEDEDFIPKGTAVYVGADGAIKHDTTAVAWACELPKGKIRVRARVYAAREEVPHHVLHHGGRIDNEEMEAFVRDELDERFSVREFAYDPTFLEDEAKHLDRDGLNVAEIPQGSNRKLRAAQAFYKAILNGEIEHDGDPVLKAHVIAASGRKVEGGWEVKKLARPGGEPKPIDALMALMFAVWRLKREETAEPWAAVLEW